MTEEEAKTKWCPHARETMDHGHGAANRDYSGKPISKCLGSGCMAWRWNEPWTSATEEGQGGDLVLRLKRKTGEPKRGFCGLAGAPQ